MSDELSAYQQGRCDGLLEYRLEIARLRTELAEVRAENDHHKRAAIKAGDWAVELSDKLKDARTERDTLRQQLAVAREGLGEIVDYRERVQIDDWDTGWNDGRGGAADIARDTLAKVDQMSQSRSEIGPKETDMDLRKMSVDALARGIKGQLVVFTEMDGPHVQKSQMVDELARRLAAAEAENDNLIFTLHRIINAVPCIDPNDGTFFVCHFDEDGNEIGVTHFQEGQIVDQILKIAREAAQRPNAGGRE